VLYKAAGEFGGGVGGRLQGAGRGLVERGERAGAVFCGRGGREVQRRFCEVEPGGGFLRDAGALGGGPASVPAGGDAAHGRGPGRHLLCAASPGPGPEGGHVQQPAEGADFARAARDRAGAGDGGAAMAERRSAGGGHPGFRARDGVEHGGNRGAAAGDAAAGVPAVFAGVRAGHAGARGGGAHADRHHHGRPGAVGNPENLGRAAGAVAVCGAGPVAVRGGDGAVPAGDFGTTDGVGAQGIATVQAGAAGLGDGAGAGGGENFKSQISDLKRETGGTGGGGGNRRSGGTIRAGKTGRRAAAGGSGGQREDGH